MDRYSVNWGHGEEQVFHVEKVIFEGQSRFQAIKIIQAEGYRRILLLDGQWQSSEADEFIYHEMLVHPAMFHHPAPKNVFIAGGGEGATAREVLRHQTVEAVTQVDIDGEVVELCRRYLPEWSAGAYEDPRLNLVIGDALAYLQETDERYDVIVLDLPDLAPDTPAEALYSGDFYRLVRGRLAPGGLATLHVGPYHPVHLDTLLLVARRLQAAFPHCLIYPVTERRWAFGMCSGSPLAKPAFDPSCLSSPLRYYNAELHAHLGVLPTYIRQAL